MTEKLNFKEATEAIRQHTEELLQVTLDQAVKPVNGKASYICPICGHGTHGDGLALIPEKGGTNTGNTLHCFGCGFSGSIISLFMEKEKTGLRQTAEQLAKLINIKIDDQAEATGLSDTIRAEKTTTAPIKADYKDYHQTTRDYLFRSPKALEYMQKRGISEETLMSCNDVGFDPQADPSGKGHPYPRMIFFKDTDSHYNSRAIEGEGLPELDPVYKKMKPAGAKEEGFFNFNTIHTAEDGEVIYIAEGETDALSVIQAGYKAVALSSVSRSDAFAEYLKHNRPSHAVRFVVTLDNDADDQTRAKVQNAANRLADKLRRMGYAAFNFPISGKYKDINEALCHDPDYLKEQISKAVDALNTADHSCSIGNTEETTYQESLYDLPCNLPDGAVKADPVQEQKQQMSYEEYINAFNGARCAVDLIHSKYRKYDPIKTGFEALDKHSLNGGLYEGLYIIGSAPSVGKTTFVMQIADQVAKSGKDVLIFSLEMSKVQLVAKSISRETHEIIDRKQMTARYAKSMTDLLTEDLDKDPINLKGDELTQHTVITDAVMNYKSYGQHVFIYESYFDVTAETIREQIELHKHFTGNVPLVIVDYLQIMGCTDKGKRTDKERTDYNVSKLKRISNDTHTSVLAVSSVNRASYDKKTSGEIDMSSMKESGGIEYGADAVIGLQFTDTSISDQENKKKMPREITAVVLKNRYGNTGTKVNYKFYSKFNRYIELEYNDYQR